MKVRIKKIDVVRKVEEYNKTTKVVKILLFGAYHRFREDEYEVVKDECK